MILVLTRVKTEDVNQKRQGSRYFENPVGCLGRLDFGVWNHGESQELLLWGDFFLSSITVH